MQETEEIFESILLIDEKITSDETQLQILPINHIITKPKKQVKRKRNKKLRRCEWKGIELPFKSMSIFMLSGHILAETKLDDDNFWNLGVERVIKSEEYCQVYTTSQENITELDSLIHAMRHSQSQYLYQKSVDLLSYKSILQNQMSISKQIQKKMDLNQLELLQEQRYNFKINFIKDYISQNLNQEDFFIVCNIDANIENGFSEIKSVFFSKSYLDLIGITENYFESSFFRSFNLFFNIPAISRRQYFEQILNGYISGESHTSKCIQNFLIQTIEEINLFCDMNFKFVDIPYPPNLNFCTEIESLHKSMDNFIVTTFSIKDHHLQTILKTRQQKQQADQNLFDFEYFMYSNIFLDKFYSNQFNPFDYRKEDNHADEDEKSRCRYRIINQII